MPTLTKPRQKQRTTSEFATQLRQRIQRGELAPGARLPSYSELREEHGIAAATAERIYNLLEKEGFAVRRQGAGTFVTHPGNLNGNDDCNGNGRPSRQNYIGFVAVGANEVPRAPIWSHLIGGVQKAVGAHQKRVVLLSHDSALGWDDVAGVLLAEVDASLALQHRPAHLPCVALQYPLPDIATVMADEYEAGRVATQHLLELGHCRIGFLHSGIATLDEVTARRLDGYRAALRGAKLQPATQWVHAFENPRMEGASGRVHLLGGFEAMRSWLRSGWAESGYTAVVAQNDHVAIGAMRALREAGIRVPEQVSVVGFDGTETGEGCEPRLCSVRMPVEDIAARGVALLAQQIETQDLLAERVLLPPQMVVRESTAPPRKT